MMPRLDGIGLLVALRSDPSLLDIPIILLSARAGEEAQVEGLRVGADDYLVKPFSARELVARVRSNLSLSKLRRQELESIARLHELGIRLTATSDLPSLLHEVLDAMMELQGADFGNVQLYDEATGTLRIAAHRGLSDEFLDYFKVVNANDTSACGLALRSGAQIVIEDVDASPDFEPHRDIAARSGFRGVQSIPLISRDLGKPIGMLSTHFRERYKPALREIRLTDLHARQAADMIASCLAEQKLRESESRLQAAVDLLSLGCYSWNPQTNELQWDDTVKAMWGLPADADVDIEVWRAAVHPDDLARVDDAIQRSSDPAGDGLYNIEYRVVGITDSVERWIRTRGKTNFENGRPVSFYGIALDVTDQKQVEKTLERRVEARTHELEMANALLRTQIGHREKAEATIQQMQRLDAIGQITSGVAHDFNNLLSVVQMNARLLLRGNLSRYDREGVELIHSAAERGIKLTTQLLAFSRKQRLDPQVINLNRKIEEIASLLRATLGGTVSLETALDETLWDTLVDPTQIELTVLNLAINARDAMPTGGTLTIETLNAVIDAEPSGPEEPPPGAYVCLIVNDTGTGIADDVLPRVFEPFFTTKERGKGSGLGLAQVYGFVKQSGGGLRIETRQGTGTTVKIFLPRIEVPAGIDEVEPWQGGREAQTQRKLRILVVDDDKSVLISTARLLDSFEYSTALAMSGEEALALVENEPGFDLVIADFAMPVMNGVELARAIHIMQPEVAVILATGYGDAELLRGFPRSRIIQKPYDVGQLIRKIADVLGHR